MVNRFTFDCVAIFLVLIYRLMLRGSLFEVRHTRASGIYIVVCIMEGIRRTLNKLRAAV